MTRRQITENEIAGLNLYQKLAEIGKTVQVLKKTKSGYGYTYTPEEDILVGVQNGMAKYHISLIPSITPGTAKTEPRDYLKTKSDKQGNHWEERANENVVSGDMRFRWVNNDNPEDFIEVPWFFVGQQSDASQAFGSALTYASRYFLLRFFSIATANDPDSLVAKKKELEAKENRAITSGILEQAGAIIGEFVKAQPDKREEVVEIVKKYAVDKGKPTGDYRKITDPHTAGELLKEITEFCRKE